MQRVQSSEDATHGFLVILSDHHTLAEGTPASFELKFDKTFGVVNKHGTPRPVPEPPCQAGGGEPEPPEGGARAHVAGLFLGGQVPLAERIAVAGPGPLRRQLLEDLPLVAPQLMTAADSRNYLAI